MLHLLLQMMRQHSRLGVMPAATRSRKSVALDADELALITQVRTPGTRERAAVELSGLGPTPSAPDPEPYSTGTSSRK
jgi:hypothetical protein